MPVKQTSCAPLLKKSPPTKLVRLRRAALSASSLHSLLDLATTCVTAPGTLSAVLQGIISARTIRFSLCHTQSYRSTAQNRGASARPAREPLPMCMSKRSALHERAGLVLASILRSFMKAEALPYWLGLCPKTLYPVVHRACCPRTHLRLVKDHALGRLDVVQQARQERAVGPGNVHEAAEAAPRVLGDDRVNCCIAGSPINFAVFAPDSKSPMQVIQTNRRCFS